MGKKWEDGLNQRLKAREKLSEQVKKEVASILDRVEDLVYKAKRLQQAFVEKESDIVDIFKACIGGWLEIELKGSQNRNRESVPKITGRIMGMEQDGRKKWHIIIMSQNKTVSCELSQIKSIRIIGD